MRQVVEGCLESRRIATPLRIPVAVPGRPNNARDLELSYGRKCLIHSAQANLSLYMAKLYIACETHQTLVSSLDNREWQTPGNVCSNGKEAFVRNLITREVMAKVQNKCRVTSAQQLSPRSGRSCVSVLK